MRSQNRKVNNVGRMSCLVLLALGLVLVNPISCLSAFAEGEDIEPEEMNYDDQVMTTAETPSTVSISFSPTSGSASISPTTSAGQSAQIKVLATVNIQKSGGYSVYVKSNSQNLVGVKSSSNVIPGMQGSATYANIPVNSWGYYATEGSVVPDNATYKAVSITGNGDKITENTSNKITNDTKTIALSFAAKINDEKPADTYQNTVTMSVISSPMQVGLMSIENMQDMTNTLCSESSIGDTKQLQDLRDGKYYWVAKLADNKCWMTQNLDLDLSTGKKLTAADSDVVSDYMPTYDTATIVDSSTINSSNTSQNSWSLGDYRIINPNLSSNCGSKKNSAADCTSQFTAYMTPATANGDVNAHYILGNHYSWNAATAGTGGTITSGQAEGSVCSKGWRLPTSGTSGEFGALVTALGGTSNTNNVTQAPFYGVRGGAVYPYTISLFRDAGYGGYYRSSTPYTSDDIALFLLFEGDSNIYSLASGLNRAAGLSVRCVAR